MQSHFGLSYRPARVRMASANGETVPIRRVFPQPARELSKFGINSASFFAGIMIVNSLFIVMDGYSCGINRDVSGSLLSPATTIEVLDSVTLRLHRFVGMAAEDTPGL